MWTSHWQAFGRSNVIGLSGQFEWKAFAEFHNFLLLRQAIEGHFQAATKSAGQRHRRSGQWTSRTTGRCSGRRSSIANPWCRRLLRYPNIYQFKLNVKNSKLNYKNLCQKATLERQTLIERSVWESDRNIIKKAKSPNNGNENSVQIELFLWSITLWKAFFDQNISFSAKLCACYDHRSGDGVHYELYINQKWATLSLSLSLSLSRSSLANRINRRGLLLLV